MVNFDILITDSAGIDCIETVVPSSQISSASFFAETQRQFSRYYNEFEELKLLGKGAFGAVVKVWYKNCFPLWNPFGGMCLFSLKQNSILNVCMVLFIIF